MHESIKKLITGTAIPLRGDEIDTDRIVPARYLRCITFDGLGEHVFEDDRKQDPNHPFDNPKYQGASILICGKNFGCGSSREHAPQALNKWGIKGIIGRSFAEIFLSNCQAMGIPCLSVNPDQCQQLFTQIEVHPDQSLTIDIEKAAIHMDGKVIPATIPIGAQQALVTGSWNATSVLLTAESDILRITNSLPYLHGFKI